MVIRGRAPLRISSVSYTHLREYLDSMEMARLERAEQEYRMQLEEEKRKEQETAKQKEEEKRLSEEAAKELQKREEEKRRNASCRQISSQCGPDARREGTGEIHFTSVRMLDGKRRETLLYKTGDALLIEMQYESKLIDEDINFIIGITRNDWVYCYGATVKQSTGNYVKSQSQGKILFQISELELMEGTYFLDVRIRNKEEHVYDNIYSLIEFKIKTPNPKDFGILSMSHTWQ